MLRQQREGMTVEIPHAGRMEGGLGAVEPKFGRKVDFNGFPPLQGK